MVWSGVNSLVVPSSNVTVVEPSPFTSMLVIPLSGFFLVTLPLTSSFWESVKSASPFTGTLSKLLLKLSASLVITVTDTSTDLVLPSGNVAIILPENSPTVSVFGVFSGSQLYVVPLGISALLVITSSAFGKSALRFTETESALGLFSSASETTLTGTVTWSTDPSL